MEFHVITPSGDYTVMTTWNGRVIDVWPAPADSLPAAEPVLEPITPR